MSNEANDDKKEGQGDEEQEVIDAAKHFCKAFKVEKELRDVIVTIMGKLGRSNLSAHEGKKYAELLKKAYKHLKRVEKQLKKEPKAKATGDS